MSEERPIALVTGARAGIGRHLAQHLLGQGYGVIGCSRSPAGWEAPGFTHERLDVTDELGVTALFRRIARDHGRLDAVINGAAVASMNHVFLTPASSLDAMLSTNVTGTFVVSREAAKLMRKSGAGRIVNLSSVAVPLRLAGQAAYVASKASVEALSQVLARELAEHGITVNVVGITPVDTEMTRGVPAEKLEQLVEALPIRRMGTMDDVANAVEFFLRPASSAVTGQVLYLGGLHA